VLEDEFHRIFDRQDVAGARAVAIIDHRRHGRRLARAGRADDQDHAELLHHKVLDDRGELELLYRRDIRLDEANHQGDRAALAEHIEAKAAKVGAADREIHLERSFVFLDLRLGHHLVRDFLDAGRVELLCVDGHHDAVDLDLDRCAGGEKHVRGLLFGHQFE
jgi:hypothetical protein